MASLLLDHNLPPQLGRLLEMAGHTAMTAYEARLDRAGDQEILQWAGGEGLVILTADDDFVRLHRASRFDHAGVLLLPEIRRADVRSVARVIAAFFDATPELTNELYAWSPNAGWIRIP